jgi:amino acid permease
MDDSREDSPSRVSFTPDTLDNAAAKRKVWLEAQNRPDALSRAEQASGGDGTFLSSVFTCANSAIGAGVLAFPYAFAQTGIVLGVVLALSLAVVMLLALHIIIVGTHSSNAASYQALVRHAMGPTAEKIVAILMVIYLFGAITGYFIVIGDMIPPIFELIPGVPGFLTGRLGRNIVMGVLSTVVCYPLCLLRNISALAYSSGAAIFAIAYMVIMVVVKSILALQERASSGGGSGGGDANVTAFLLLSDGRTAAVAPTVLVRPSPSIFLAIPLIAFALQAHVQVPNIYAGLSTTKRNDLCCRGKMLKQVWIMDWVLIASYAICLCFYIPAGIFGYLQFGDGDTPADVLAKGGYPENDPAVIVARICVTLTAMACVPINHFPARVAIWGLYRHVRYGLGASNADASDATEEGDTPKPDLTKIPAMFHIIETTVFFFGALLLAELCTDISIVFDLLGSTIAVLVIFILPAWFFWVYLAGGRGGVLLARRSNRLGIFYNASCRSWVRSGVSVRDDDSLAAGLLRDPAASEEEVSIDGDDAPDGPAYQCCFKILSVIMLVIGVFIFCSSTATTIIKMVLTDKTAIQKICLTNTEPCQL